MLWESALKRYTNIWVEAKGFLNVIFCFMSYFLLFQLGYELKEDQVENLFWRFKAVAEQKKVDTN